MSKLRKIAVLENLEHYLNFTKDFLIHEDCNEDVIGDLSLVIEELLVNIISYSYPSNQKGYADLELSKIDGKIIICVIDKGIPFNILNIKKPDLSASIEERSIGGVGIHLIKSYVDDIHYIRQDDENIVTLIKIL